MGVITHGGLVLGLLKSLWKRRASSSRMATPLPLESAPYDNHCVTRTHTKNMHKYRIFNSNKQGRIKWIELTGQTVHTHFDI